MEYGENIIFMISSIRLRQKQTRQKGGGNGKKNEGNKGFVITLATY